MEKEYLDLEDILTSLWEIILLYTNIWNIDWKTAQDLEFIYRDYSINFDWIVPNWLSNAINNNRILENYEYNYWITTKEIILVFNKIIYSIEWIVDEDVGIAKDINVSTLTRDKITNIIDASISNFQDEIKVLENKKLILNNLTI